MVGQSHCIGLGQNDRRESSAPNSGFPDGKSEDVDWKEIGERKQVCNLIKNRMMTL